MIQELDIVLTTSGVTTINVIEDELILHVKYDGNNDTYHNLHKIFLNHDFDIVSCQIWFEQIGQNETEAELILAGAIKTLTITPNTKKTSLTLVVDKTLIGAQRFFAEAISGDLSLQAIEDSFVTTEVFNQTIEQIYNDLSLTAEKIVQNATNPNTSTSTIELTNDKASFFVQTNTVDFVVDQVYADWGYTIGATTSLTTTTGLNMVDQVGTLSAGQIASLFADYPRPEYQLYPFHDLNLTNLSFYVMRNMEAYWLNVTEFLLTAYTDRFGFILDTSILGSEFVKIQLTNLNIISGSPNATGSPSTNSGTFPLMAVGTTARPTIKYRYGTFKIWKNDNTTRDNIIFSVPLTNTRVQSTKTINGIENINFWINNEGWYFGEKSDAEKLFAPIVKSYDIDIGTANITLENGMDDTILPISFARMNPSFGPSLPASNGQIVFNNTNLVDEINFTLRIIASGVQNGQNITIKQGVTPIYTYTTSNTDSAKPNVSDLLIRANSSLIEVVPIIEIKNQQYYDWNFTSADSSLSVARIMKTPAKVLTTAQYNSFNPDSPIILNVSANGKAPITLNSLSFYTLRNHFDVYTNSGTFVYNTATYKNRLQINIDTTSLSSTEWVPLNLIGLYYKQGVPIANNKMFPASTSSTTNYTNLRASTLFQGKINIGNIDNSYFSLPVGESVKDAIISAKFRIQKDGINTKLYQGLESESSNIIFSEPNTIPLDLSYKDKIFYPTFSNSYNWVTYYENFTVTAPYSAAPIGTSIYQFFLRLYCVYGSTFGNINKTGMTYVSSSNSFEGRPTNSGGFINYNFTLTLSHQISSSYFQTSYNIPYPSFPMNDLRVVDLIFEVDQNFFNATNLVDAKKKLKYLGQRIIKL